MCVAAFSVAQNMCRSYLMYCMSKYISGCIFHILSGCIFQISETHTKISFVRHVLQKHLHTDLIIFSLKKKKKQMHIVCSLFFLTSVILKLCLHTKCNKIWGKIYGDWLVLNAFLFWGKLFLITMAFHVLLSHVSCSGGCSQALHLPVICSYFCM